MGCFNFGKGKKTEPNKNVASKRSTSTPSQRKAYTEKSKNSSSSVKPDQPISKSVTTTPSRCSLPNLYEQRGQKLRIFDFEELRAATNNFNRALKLGEGGFGAVFKGFLKGRDSNGQRLVVAVKRLKQSSLQVQHLYQSKLEMSDYDQLWYEHIYHFILANLVHVQLSIDAFFILANLVHVQLSIDADR
jgi:hypothetical protein